MSLIHIIFFNSQQIPLSLLICIQRSHTKQSATQQQYCTFQDCCHFGVSYSFPLSWMLHPPKKPHTTIPILMDLCCLWKTLYYAQIFIWPNGEQERNLDTYSLKPQCISKYQARMLLSTVSRKTKSQEHLPIWSLWPSTDPNPSSPFHMLS